LIPIATNLKCRGKFLPLFSSDISDREGVVAVVRHFGLVYKSHYKAAGIRSISFAKATWFITPPEGELPHIDRVRHS
jgi:hypothetical protein